MLNWEQRKLGNHAYIKGRLGWKNLKQNEYTDAGPSMIAGRHIENGAVDWSSVDHIPLWRYDESPEIMLQNNDIIFSKDGTLGNPAMIKNLDTKATINATMMLVRMENTIRPSFLFQILNSKIFERLIHLKVSGSSIPHLFQADMNDFRFFAPEKYEQDKITSILDKMDELITLHKRKLLIYKRLRDYYSSLFYSTDRGIIFSNSRDAWKKEKLSKVFYPHKLSDVIFSEEDKDLTGDKLYIITQGDTPIKEITKGTGNQDYEEVIFFGDHTLSLSKINGPYKVDTDGVKVLHVDKDFDRDFIFYLIKCNMPASEGYKRHFTILKNKKVWLTTDIDEQVKISNTLNLLDKLVSSQNNKIEKLQNLRTEYLNTLFI